MKFSGVLNAAMGRVVLVVQMAVAENPWRAVVLPTVVRLCASIMPRTGVAFGVVAHSVILPSMRTQLC